MYNVEAIAVRLADEGVPLRAIARAINTPSDQLRTKLREARDEGRLLDLPKEDWPPGFPRDQRALQLSRMVTRNPEAVTLAANHIFGLTATEVTLDLDPESRRSQGTDRHGAPHHRRSYLSHQESLGAVRDSDRNHLGLRLPIIRS
jgi:hypothetical protein